MQESVEVLKFSQAKNWTRRNQIPEYKGDFSHFSQQVNCLVQGYQTHPVPWARLGSWHGAAAGPLVAMAVAGPAVVVVVGLVELLAAVVRLVMVGQVAASCLPQEWYWAKQLLGKQGCINIAITFSSTEGYVCQGPGSWIPWQAAPTAGPIPNFHRLQVARWERSSDCRLDLAHRSYVGHPWPSIYSTYAKSRTCSNLHLMLPSKVH